MKKKVIGIISLVLAGTMMTISLTGCGTQVKATDQEVPMEEETIVVSEDNSLEDTIADIEDEITEAEEMIGDAAEDAAKEASYTEHEYFFALDEQDPSTAQEIDMNALEPDGNDYELKESVTLYGSGLGRIAGYTKPNIEVHVVTSNADWYCISFADEEPKFQLVLVKAKDFIAASGMNDNIPAVTYDDVEFALKDNLYSADYGVDYDVYFVVLDTPMENMESVEFVIPTYCIDISERMQQVIDANKLGNYSRFYIEQLENKSDSESLCFRIFYGELQGYAK